MFLNNRYLKAYLKRVPGLRKVVRFLRGQPTHSPRERLLKKMPNKSVGAEIGVHKGDYSEEILRYVSPTKLHLIDPWKHEEGEEYKRAWYGSGASKGQATMDSRYRSVMRRFATEIKSGRVVLHRGYSSDVANEFSDDYFDWIYIDGNHLHDYVKTDLDLYFPKVKPGGYIAGDDYGVQGWWNNGVQTAVDEFIRQRPQLSLEILDGQFIIKKSTQRIGA